MAYSKATLHQFWFSEELVSEHSICWCRTSRLKKEKYCNLCGCTISSKTKIKVLKIISVPFEIFLKNVLEFSLLLSYINVSSLLEKSWYLNVAYVGVVCISSSAQCFKTLNFILQVKKICDHLFFANKEYGYTIGRSKNL